MTNRESSIFNRQAAAIMLIIAGWGWIAGNFAAPFDTFWLGVVINLGHSIPIFLMLVLSLQFFRSHEARQRNASSTSGTLTGISILAVVAVIGSIVLILIGASNADPNAVGVKTLTDFLPVIVLNMGALTWFTTLLPFHRRVTRASTASNE